ncbi:phosphopantetheine-binding protein [Bradyrhizobium tunisiense]|uniref:phosphopantetheine-binding protein n=1 Tax=Bradyrhizobium tunisiense TaxID=3278709 RepID=UPI0035DEC5BB
METALAQIWAELLGLERVGRHNHFFALGGHSLLAVQFLRRALDLGLSFNAADLFQAPILQDLALKTLGQRQLSSSDVISSRQTDQSHHFSLLLPDWAITPMSSAW